MVDTPRGLDLNKLIDVPSGMYGSFMNYIKNVWCHLWLTPCARDISRSFFDLFGYECNSLRSNCH